MSEGEGASQAPVRLAGAASCGKAAGVYAARPRWGLHTIDEDAVRLSGAGVDYLPAEVIDQGRLSKGGELGVPQPATGTAAARV